MIWVAPLALYLLSFILSFDHHGWYQRKFYLPLLVFSLTALAVLPTLGLSAAADLRVDGDQPVGFFVACMVCHGELARLQPHPSQLTGYYLMLAVGGAVGGFFVGVVAPYWFNSNYELSIGILLTGLVAAIAIIPTVEFSLAGAAASWRRIAATALGLLLLALGWIRVDDHVAETSGAPRSPCATFYGTLQVFANARKATAACCTARSSMVDSIWPPTSSTCRPPITAPRAVPARRCRSRPQRPDARRA
jgi:hypothetical protein